MPILVYFMFFLMITLVFTILKMFSIINWKWILVVSPLWIAYMILVIVVLILSCINSPFKKYIKYGEK